MREVHSRRVQMRKRRRIRNYLAFSLLLLFLCLSGMVYNTMTVEATQGDSPADGLYKYYTEVRVCRDDTLWSIANEYIGEGYDSLDDFIEEIRDLNSITFNKIQYGQRLVIPYYSSELK